MCVVYKCSNLTAHCIGIVRERDYEIDYHAIIYTKTAITLCVGQFHNTLKPQS